MNISKNIRTLLSNYTRISEKEQIPGYIQCKHITVSFDDSDSEKKLWIKHDAALQNKKINEIEPDKSLLDLKIELSNRIIGFEYSLDTLLKDFAKQIYVFDNNRKIWIKDFCDFQYGELKEESNCKPILSYINLLKNIIDEGSREILIALAEEEISHKLRFKKEYKDLMNESDKK